MSIPKELRKDLEPILSSGVKKLFSELFCIEIINDDLVSAGESKDLTCIGRLYQNDLELLLRFVFQHQLLKALLSQMYSPEYLKDPKVYEDAAGEIVNMLCAQVKAFLNKNGYNLNMDIPKVNHDITPAQNNGSLINLSFSTNDSDGFYVDLKEHKR